MKKTKISMQTLLIAIGAVPLIVGVIIAVVFSTNTLKGNLKSDYEQTLQIATESAAEFYGMKWEDFITEVSEKDEAFVDNLQKNGIEQTVFVGDTRYLSSIRKEDGSRVKDTKADPEIASLVLSGKDYQGEGVIINNKAYMVYYTPIKLDDGSIPGMMFAGFPEEKKEAL